MIYLLPGMGADHTMYNAPSWQGIKGARFLDWPEYHGETSIVAMADRVIEQAAIPDGAIVIGTSLGGIVACEIARRRRLKALVLISSATHRQEFSAILAALHPLARLAPIEFIQAAAGKIPSDLAGMFARSQAPFIRAMCMAIFEWAGLEESRITPLRIHGKRDHVIPPPAKVDLALDGGHLISMSHADECVNFLKQRQLVGIPL
jgi:pimeloyl-ACP methyl ester carboxylesterase